MCASCGGTCGVGTSHRARRTIVDVTVNGRTVFVRDSRSKTFDRMPLVSVRVRDNVPIGDRLERTREGFLLCRAVPLARTGEQIYFAHQLPGVPALNGRITAQRDGEEVFNPAAIASFYGKPFTDDHPRGEVMPSNYRNHLIGAVLNPRRGTGDHVNHVVGDIMVYDCHSSDAIESQRKTEVSVGYNCDHEIIAPGRTRQVNISCNHVSLVDQGRCGPTCAIHH